MDDRDHGSTDQRISRRSLLKNIGAAGVLPVVAGSAATGVQTPDPQVHATHPARPGREARNDQPALHRITVGRMVVEFDKDLGTIHGITASGDPLGTNFLGNQLNTRGVALGDPHWTGDLVATVWHVSAPAATPFGQTTPRRSARWQRETTLDSEDIRKVSVDAGNFQVRYQGTSKNKSGIRSFALAMTYHSGGDNSLLWDIEVENATGQVLEVGELALPLRADDDYGALYRGAPLPDAATLGRTTAIQKAIHEQKVLAHAFVAGHSSYVLLQRPRGDTPFLLVHCAEDTPLECIYKIAGSFAGDWIGTDLLAIHSWATSQQRDWGWDPWVNGHTSLTLQPGQRRSFRLRFVFVNDYAAIREELVNSGNLGVRVVPSMVVQERSDVLVEVKSRADLEKIEIHADGVQVKERKRVGNATLLKLSFAGRGQKSLKLMYGGGRWTNLHFFCVDDAAQLLKARADFMARRQYYENPEDPYHRNHLFLPFDYRQGKMIDDFQDVWEVGGTGDPGFGEPLFLAAKNVVYPSRLEIDRLETYVDDCLFRYIQNPKTWEVRASLYWKDRYPSSPSSTYSKERSEVTTRTYGYCFVANIYHALYRTGKLYGLLRRREAEEYLRMAYETCRKWFVTGTFKWAGMITGCNAVEILADLEKEGWAKEHAELLALMKTCNDEFVRDPYPYSSEIEIDETGQNQVYFFTRLFAGLGSRESREKNEWVVRVLKALRGGDQPVWFAYGIDLFAHPDLRGQISCWHSGSLNGLALLAYYDESSDPVALMKGYPGVMSVLHNLHPDGMGYGWFTLTPGIFNYEPARTFESGPGLWGYLRAAKSYVVDDSVFGLVGYGCSLETTQDEIRVIPQDGVRKRIRLVSDRIDIEASTGEITQAAWNKQAGLLTLEMADSTGLVRSVNLAVKGLQPGIYEIRRASTAERREVKEILSLALPLSQAKSIAIRRVKTH